MSIAPFFSPKRCEGGIERHLTVACGTAGAELSFIKKEVLCRGTIPLLFFIRLCPKAEARANGFGAESVVLRPEGVYTYTERKETAVE